MADMKVFAHFLLGDRDKELKQSKMLQERRKFVRKDEKSPSGSLESKSQSDASNAFMSPKAALS